MTRPALLALADGSVFHGVAVGAAGQAVGEVVFNTAMSGYQEIYTDPSYRGQLVTLTCPHIGNVGTNPQDAESAQVQVAGVILRERPRAPSNFRSDQHLEAWLTGQGCVGIAEIDTRRLTRHIRSAGAQNGCIASIEQGDDIDAVLAGAVEAAKGAPSLGGQDLAKSISTETTYEWTEPSWRETAPPLDHHVVVYDFGVKRNILRMLVDAGCRLTVVPAQTPAAEVLAMKPDGVMLSNGPGDPEPCDYAIRAATEIMAAKLPLMGICLGHQILALACGGQTVKMKFGHHGANHPVKDEVSGRVMITSQNHGFSVDEASLPDAVKVTHRSLFDGTLQGILRSDVPAFSFQGHPEASPGPHDVAPMFARFVEMMERHSA